MRVGKRDVRIFLQALVIGLLAGAIITYALVHKNKAHGMVSEKVCLNQMIKVAATCKPQQGCT